MRKLLCFVLVGGILFSLACIVMVKVDTITDVDADAYTIRIKYAPGEDHFSISKNIQLPTKVDNGSVVSWASENPAVITPEGTVTRPADGKDAYFNLIATISKGSVSKTEIYAVRVVQKPIEDEAVVDEDIARLKIGYEFADYADSVTKNLQLPTRGENSSVITWSSDRPAIIDSAGKVQRPTDGQSVRVNLTATVTKNSVSKKVPFELKVIKDSRAIPCTDYFLVESPEEALKYIHSVKAKMNIADPEKELIWDTTNGRKFPINYRFQQVYNGIPVYRKIVKVSTDDNGVVTSFSNGYIPEVRHAGIEVTSKISSEEAKAFVKRHVPKKSYIEDCQLCIYTEDDVPPCLAWQFTIFDKIDKYYFINAYNGKLIASIDCCFREPMDYLIKRAIFRLTIKIVLIAAAIMIAVRYFKKKKKKIAA